MNVPAICPCGLPEYPVVPVNPPGRSVIDYRVADFVSFRHALLHSLDGEVQLAGNWRPGADGDLAVQIVEWWAYLGDILTLYTERIAHQAYLRTADQPASLRSLIRLLGYRPRPGIGAQGTVAALVSAASSMAVTLPRGFKIQSKSGPGKTPQVFELDADTAVAAPDAVPFDPLPQQITSLSDALLLRGAVTTVRRGDQVIVLEKGWSGSPNPKGDIATVLEVRPEKDPRGAVNTRVKLDKNLGLPGSPEGNGKTEKGYRLLRRPLIAYPWQFTGGAISSGHLDLQSVVRQIHIGDTLLLVDSSSSPLSPYLLIVTGYQELVWYANQTEPNNPGTPPSVNPIPILHTELKFSPAMPTSGTGSAADWNSRRDNVSVLYGWSEAGQLISDPARAFVDTAAKVTAVFPATFPPPPATSPSYELLIEDVNGAGRRSTGTPNPDLTALDLEQPTAMAPPLTTPLRGLFNLLPVSRGETVSDEVLGSGDVTQAGQGFVLKKSPLTYLPDPQSASGNAYRSTLRVWVDRVEWREVASFYGQLPTAHVFVTREDEAARTHVLFGDGINGARLPAGLGNVLASYRVGGGADAPPAGSLTVIVKPHPNLKAIRNPLSVGGGADPDPPDKIRLYAPRSVLAFGRAVSAQDYETIAAQVPGVARARAYWSWDPGQARNAVKVYVGDDPGAVDAADQALKGAVNPNRPLQILPAIAIGDPNVTVWVARQPGARSKDVVDAVTSALFDPYTGFFGVSNMRIGRSIFESELVAACMSAPGVAAVHMVDFATSAALIAGVRWDPGEGGYFAPQKKNLVVGVEGA